MEAGLIKAMIEEAFVASSVLPPPHPQMYSELSTDKASNNKGVNQ
jgi:hypothetical protein